MSKKHISVWKAYLVWAFALLMVLGGLATVGLAASPDAGTTGVGLILGGFLLMILNKFVFKLRSSQLKVDTMESHRDSIGNACPECGTRNQKNASYCDNCGVKF